MNSRVLSILFTVLVLENVYAAAPQASLAGAAVQFDGVNDHIQLPAFTIGAPLTLEAWVYCENPYVQWSRVYDLGNGQDTDNIVVAFNNGKMHVDIRDGSNVLGPATITTDVFPANIWTHVAVTLDNAGNCKIYWNGVLKATGTPGAPPTRYRSSNFIARSNWSGDGWFVGKMDDCRIWNVVRTQSEIQGNMSTQLRGNEAGLACYYRFDEFSGATAVDSSTSNLNGTYVNGAFRVPAPGTVSLDGIDDFIATPDVRGAFSNDTVTMEIRFKAQGPGVIVTEANDINVSSWHDSQIEILSNGDVKVSVWDNRSGINIGNVAFNTWHHAVVRYNGATQTLDGFLDGVKATPSANFNRQAPFENGQPTLQYLIGHADVTNLGNGGWLKGEVRDFAVWNVARTDSEIQNNYSQGLTGNESGLVCYYRLDESSGTTVFDRSPNNRNGTLFNNNLSSTNTNQINTTTADSVIALAGFDADGDTLTATITSLPEFGVLYQYAAPFTRGAKITSPGTVVTDPQNRVIFYSPVTQNTTIGYSLSDGSQTASATVAVNVAFSPGIAGQALLFNGNGYASFARPVQDDFTIELWFSSTQVTGAEQFWYLGVGLIDGEVAGIANDFGVSLGNGKVCFGVGNVGGVDVSLASGFVADGEWHHVAAVRSTATQQILLYVDGNLVGSDSGGSHSLSAPTNLRIGSLQTALNYFRGSIDEVRIWNVARSQSEINASKNRSLLGQEPGLVRYFRMDESGSTLVDSVSNSPSAGLVNTAHCGSAAKVDTLVVRSNVDSTIQLQAFAPVPLMTRIENTPSNGGTLYQYSNGARGTQINSLDAVTDLNNRAVFAPSNVGNSAFTFTATDGVIRSSVSNLNVFVLTSQTITFGAIAHKLTTDVPFSITATSDSGLPVTLSVVSGPATITPPGTSPATVNLTGQYGTVVIRATQLGDSTYYPATPVTQQFVVNALPTAGLAGGEIKFDGVDDAVRVPGFGASIPTGEITVEFWQNATSTKNQTAFQLVPDSTTNRFAASTPYGDGNIIWDFGDSTGNGRLSSADPGSTGAWHHFAFVASQTGSFMKAYRDGVELANTPNMTSFNNAVASAAALYIGGDASALAFLGEIDEFRIWNTARSQTSIQAAMNVSLVGNETGLVAYWRFDESNGGTTADSSPFGNTGTLSGGPLRIPSGASVNTVIAAQGSDKVISLIGFDPEGATLTYKIESVPTNGGALYQFNNGARGAKITGTASVTDSNGRVIFASSTAGTSSFTYSVADSLDSSSPATVYVNVVAPQTITFAPLAGKNQNDPPFTISATSDSGLPVSFIVVSGPATIAAPGTSPATLTLTGVPGTVVIRAYQPGDGVIPAATPVDQSFYVNGVPLAGLAGAAIDFDGVDDSITIARKIQDDFTIEFWLNTAQSQGTDTTWDKAKCVVDASVGKNHNDFGIGISNGKIHFGTGNPITTIRSGDVADSTWHHVAVTRQRSTGAIALYVDGTLVDSAVGNKNGLLDSSIIRLAGSASGGGRAYNGLLDEVRLWNVVRTPQQISTFMQQSLNGNETGLVTYLRFDELNGTKTADSSPSNNTGTLFNGPARVQSAVPLKVFTSPGANVTIKLLGVDFENSPLTARIESLPTNASLLQNDGTTAIAASDNVVDSQRRVIFNAATAGAYSFTYTVTDGAARSLTATVNVAVQGAQTITFPPIPTKDEGDPPFTISATASSNLPVTFSIDSGPATISGNQITLTGPGTVAVRASQAGNNLFSAAADVVQTFTVRAAQTITFGPLPDKTFGDAPIALSATATSGLAVSFSATGPATVNGNTLTIIGAGSVSVTASQAGDATHAPAPSVTQSFNVAPADQTISFGALGDKTFGDAPFSVSATASSNLQVSFQVDSGPATVNGSTVTITGAGTVSITATQAGDANYNAAAPITQSFNVLKATPVITWSKPADVVEGTALSSTQLNATASVPGTFTYTPVDGTVLNFGLAQTLSVQFTPDDSANYNSTSASVQINVSRAGNTAPTINSAPTATPNPALVGQTIIFAVSASDAQNDPLTYTWDFGDNTNDVGASTSHAYVAEGTYNVSVTVADGNGGTVNASLSVTIASPNGTDTDGDGIPDAIDPDADNDGFSNADEMAAGTDPLDPVSNVGPNGDIDKDGIPNSMDDDDDGDGFSDQLEALLGSSSSNASSTPMGAGATPPQALTITKMSVRLNFSKPASDSIAFGGTLPVTAGFTVAGAQIGLDAGGVAKMFTLDGKGRSPKGNDSFKISIKAKSGVVAAQTSKFAVKLSRGDFANALADEGLTNGDATNKSTPINVLLIFNQATYAKAQPQIYSAKTGKSGKTK